MTLIESNGYQITTEDTDFKPIELTVKITSRELYNELVAVVNKAQNDAETVAYVAYAMADDSINEFINSVFNAITK